jgi:hypothetical protein
MVCVNRRWKVRSFVNKPLIAVQNKKMAAQPEFSFGGGREGSDPEAVYILFLILKLCCRNLAQVFDQTSI